MLEEDDAVAQTMSSLTSDDCGGAKDVETNSTTRTRSSVQASVDVGVRVDEHVKAERNFHACQGPVRIGSAQRTIRSGLRRVASAQVRVVERSYKHIGLRGASH